MLRSLKPFLHFDIELLHRHTGERRGEDFLQIGHCQLGHRLTISGKHGLERFDILEFRLLRYHRWNAIEAVDHL